MSVAFAGAFRMGLLANTRVGKFQHLFLSTVAKSWADVVKLSARPTQAKAVKRGPPRLPSKRPRRVKTPKVRVLL